MGLKDCTIKLNSPWGGYYPGQTVSGTVVCTFDSSKTLRGIYVKLKGRAETRWSESKTVRSNGKSRTHHVTYSADEEYFNQSYYLLGTDDGEKIEVPAGTYTYEFNHRLPLRLPSSFEGQHGFIRYTIKATIDRPWKFDHETKMAFTVVSHMDLNTLPIAKSPIEMLFKKRFCCCCCKSAPLSVDVEIPKSGYCSGEKIPVTITVENGSRVAINEIIIKLKKIVTYTSHTPYHKSKSSSEPLEIVRTEKVKSHSTMNFSEILDVPPLPPSNLLNCTIIDLDYEIKVTLVTAGCHMNIDKTSKIYIGTVPLGYNKSASTIHLDQIPNEVSPLLVTTFSKSPNLPLPQQIGNPSNPIMPYHTNQPPPQPQPFNNPYGQYQPQPISVPCPPYPTQSPAPYPFGSNAGQNLTYPPSMPPVVPSYPTGYTYNTQTQNNQPANSTPSAPQMDDATNPPVNPMCLYPTAQPLYRESQYAATTIHDGTDNQHTRIVGNINFSPVYPTYGFISN